MSASVVEAWQLRAVRRLRPQNPAPGVDGFFMRGEARPLGFVAIGKKGTRFISVAKTSAK
jgi:hypothetical protein